MQPVLNDYISYRPLYNDDVPMDKRKAFYVARVIALQPNSESVQVQTYFTNAKPENLLLTGKRIKYRIYTGRAASVQDVKVADVFTVVKLTASGTLASASKGDVTSMLSRKAAKCTRYWPGMQYDAEVELLRLLQEEHCRGLLETNAFISYKPLHEHHHLERDDSPMNARSAFYVAKVLGLQPLDESVRVLTYFTPVEPPYLLSPGKATEYYHYHEGGRHIYCLQHSMRARSSRVGRLGRDTEEGHRAGDHSQQLRCAWTTSRTCRYRECSPNVRTNLSSVCPCRSQTRCGCVLLYVYS
jgi:hypothetical protein